MKGMDHVLGRGKWLPGDRSGRRPGQVALTWKRTVGARLKAVREATGYRRARAFARALGVQENTYTSWERGDRVIHPEALGKVRALTGVTADYIYYGDPTALSESLVAALGLEQP